MTAIARFFFNISDLTRVQFPRPQRGRIQSNDEILPKLVKRYLALLAVAVPAAFLFGSGLFDKKNITTLTVPQIGPSEQKPSVSAPPSGLLLDVPQSLFRPPHASFTHLPPTPPSPIAVQSLLPTYLSALPPLPILEKKEESVVPKQNEDLSTSLAQAQEKIEELTTQNERVQASFAQCRAESNNLSLSLTSLRNSSAMMHAQHSSATRKKECKTRGSVFLNILRDDRVFVFGATLLICTLISQIFTGAAPSPKGGSIQPK